MYHNMGFDFVALSLTASERAVQRAHRTAPTMCVNNKRLARVHTRIWYTCVPYHYTYYTYQFNVWFRSVQSRQHTRACLCICAGCFMCARVCRRVDVAMRYHMLPVRDRARRAVPALHTRRCSPCNARALGKYSPCMCAFF